jgi:NAD(P)-dependent dehydrogenase (short-subunit alcohol dehydrogenase family)
LKNPFSLEEKIVLITGASSGIGRQCAISCSQMGAKTILIARNEERLKETLSQLEGDNHLMYSLDITKFDKIESIIKNSISKIGKIDGFIHSAGIERTLPLGMMKPELYQEIFNVNVIAGFELTKIISKKMYREKRASFVFISSIMSVLGQSGKVGYCSSKSAIVGGVNALALELASKKIRVNSISPAVIKTSMSQKLYDSLSLEEQKIITGMHPLGLGKPEDVANACIYLLSDATRWVTGTNLIVDGGYSAR